MPHESEGSAAQTDSLKLPHKRRGPEPQTYRVGLSNYAHKISMLTKEPPPLLREAFPLGRDLASLLIGRYQGCQVTSTADTAAVSYESSHWE